MDAASTPSQPGLGLPGQQEACSGGRINSPHSKGTGHDVSPFRSLTPMSLPYTALACHVPVVALAQHIGDFPMAALLSHLSHSPPTPGHPGLLQ